MIVNRALNSKHWKSYFENYKGFNFFQSLFNFELNSFDRIEKFKETGY